MHQLRIINVDGSFHGFNNGSSEGFVGSTVVEVFEKYYGRTNRVERDCLSIVQMHIYPSMCLWLYGNRSYWFARIGRCEFEEVIDSDIEGSPQEFSRFRAATFKDYCLTVSRICWTDAITKLEYDYERNVWWREIHNSGRNT